MQATTKLPVRPAIRPPAPISKAPSRRTPKRGWLYIKILVWCLALAPVGLLLFDALTGQLQAEPVKDITHRTGWWALTLLLATLAITPIRYITGWKQIVKLRRPVGLFAFFYATLHVLTYFGLDQFFAFDYILEDIVDRPYITVGFTAWVLLIPLTITSTKGWIRKLGKNWQRLHRLVYVVAILGVLHFLWLVKADVREPLIFGAVLAVLLVFRFGWVRRMLRIQN
jgi:sulfoxide reductase heme-binding subunit YedZ